MKKIVILYVVIIALAFQACDKIDGPYTTPVPGKNWYGRKVLLEDYTGHTCVNCPRAAVVAKNLEALYGDEIVVIAAHVGFFAWPFPGDNMPQDFRTPAGEAWDAKFIHSDNGLPKGMINRAVFSGEQVFDDGAWASKISSVITQIPYMSITFQNNTYTAADSTVTGKTDVKFLKANQYKLNLQICITEDSIIGPQKNDPSTGDPTQPAFIPNYIFMHMLRGAVNGSWGQQITDGTTYNLVGTEITPSYTYTIPKSKWNAKNCHIVAFVYDAVTYEVYQAEQIALQ